MKELVGCIAENGIGYSNPLISQTLEGSACESRLRSAKTCIMGEVTSTFLRSSSFDVLGPASSDEPANGDVRIVLGTILGDCKAPATFYAEYGIQGWRPKVVEVGCNMCTRFMKRVCFPSFPTICMQLVCTTAMFTLNQGLFNPFVLKNLIVSSPLFAFPSDIYADA